MQMNKLALCISLIAISANAEVVVKIGQVSPLTGGTASYGKDSELGVKLAIDDLNAKKLKVGSQTVRFELLSEDDAADPKTANVVAQKLVDSGVKAVIGHMNSGTSIPASKIYNSAGIPQVTPSATNPKLTQQGFNNVFRLVANDVQQGGAIGKFAVQVLKGKSVAIIDDRTAYGQGLADEVEKAVKSSAAKISIREFGTDKTTDWMPVVTLIKAKNPDVVVYAGMDATAAPLLQQLRRMGVKAAFIGGDGVCSQSMIDLTKGSIDNATYCSEAGLPRDKMPKGKAFEARFKSKFGTDVLLNAPYAYDATFAVANAMQKAGSVEPKIYLPVLSKNNFEGVTGNVAFDAKGDLIGGAVSVKQFDGKSWSVVKVVK